MDTENTNIVVCYGCNMEILDGSEIVCSVKKCSKVFDRICSNSVNVSCEESKTWNCPNCQASKRKVGDYTLTPLRPATSADGLCNVSTKQRNPETQIKPTANSGVSSHELQVLTDEIRLMRHDMSCLASTLTERLDILTAKLSNSEERIKSLEKSEQELRESNITLKATVTNLEDRLNSVAQATLRSELEIIGLEETRNENSFHIVLTTAQKIGVELCEADIDDASRAGPRRRDGDSNAEETKYLPRPLVVRFARRAKRDEFLKASKSRRNLDSKDIVGAGPERRVFLNERLTPSNRRLFRNARAHASCLGFRYCWTRYGSIFVRKREGSPAKQIRCEEDLERLIGLRVSKPVEDAPATPQ